MTLRILSAAVAAAAMIALAPSPSMAQDSGSAPPATAHFTPEQSARFSKQIEHDLAGRGARVAIVFRTGRARASLPKGIAYTHGGFFVYRDIKTAEGGSEPGYAVYNLYAGDGHAWPTDQSRLVQDFPFDFARGAVEEDVAIIIPSPEMQRRILKVIDSPLYERLHNPSYSLIANPLRSDHQNCNTFMLDVVASAAWDTPDPAQIRADERAHFIPSPVEANLLMRLFGPMADNRLKTDDQTRRIQTATYESMAAFMRDNGLLGAAYSLNFKP